MKNKIKREDAARIVFRALPPHVASGLGGESWRSIAEWRAGLAGKVKPERIEEGDGFRTTFAQLSAHPGDVQKRAKIMIQAISKAYQTFGET